MWLCTQIRVPTTRVITRTHTHTDHNFTVAQRSYVSQCNGWVRSDRLDDGWKESHLPPPMEQNCPFRFNIFPDSWQKYSHDRIRQLILFCFKLLHYCVFRQCSTWVKLNCKYLFIAAQSRVLLHKQWNVLFVTCRDIVAGMVFTLWVCLCARMCERGPGDTCRSGTTTDTLSSGVAGAILVCLRTYCITTVLYSHEVFAGV